MNKRIKEFAEKSRIKDHWSIDEGRYLTNYLDEKKFAELIIKECANRATWAQDTGEADIGGEVLKHFGVEE